jgi:hypothetical protein
MQQEIDDLDGWDGVIAVRVVPTPALLARRDRLFWRLGATARPTGSTATVVLAAPDPAAPVPLSGLFGLLFEAARWQRLGLLPIRLALSSDLPRCLAAPFGLPGHEARRPGSPVHRASRGPTLACGACPAGGRTCEGLPAGVVGAYASRDDLRRDLAALLRTPAPDAQDGAWLQHDLGLRSAVRTLDDGSGSAAAPPGLATCAVDVPLSDGAGGWLEPTTDSPRRIVYAGRDAAEIAALAELEGRLLAGRAPLDETHETLGRAFGYPPCCVEAFVADNRVYEAAGRPRWGVNPVHVDRICERSRSADALLNPFLRGTRALRLIEHLPCRFDCEPSRTLARSVARELLCRAPALGPVLSDLLPSVALVLPDRDEVLFRGRVEAPQRARLERVLQPGALVGDALFAADALELRAGPSVVLLAGEQVLQAVDVAPLELAPGLPRFVAFGVP